MASGGGELWRTADVSRLAERPAHVSGSGSTLFVLCDDPMHAEFLATRIERDHDVPAIPVKTTAGATPGGGPTFQQPVEEL